MFSLYTYFLVYGRLVQGSCWCGTRQVIRQKRTILEAPRHRVWEPQNKRDKQINQVFKSPKCPAPRPDLVLRYLAIPRDKLAMMSY
ncbi:hypothetical protein E2C01_000285 [Portunus trituberculatus]|uniref:Uncharacterized protein n=1 Tax=Portunus trituberculatus TaxID=210409 RepID=A0A5B7CDW8_PORTR|nr:hypothetical protein [Portunus trituberculatus]